MIHDSQRLKMSPYGQVVDEKYVLFGYVNITSYLAFSAATVAHPDWLQVILENKKCCHLRKILL